VPSLFLLRFALVFVLVLHEDDAYADEAEPRPNVIVILADDLGIGDTSVYGGWVKTPQLERMAAEGKLFTDFHANSSVCSPTRAAFLTGRYQQRVGIVDVVARHLDTPGLSPGQLTIPRLLKQNGYTTGLFGKWHLGSAPEHNPVHHGFDQFRGYLPGYIDYHAHKSSWYNGLKKEDQPGYVTHLITENSLKFIEENKSRPFFLFVSHEAVHLPFQTPDDTPEKRKPIPRGQRWSRERIRPKYKVMLEVLDEGVGKILDTVNRAGISERTLVFFFSDNGAIGAGSNKPYRGGKFSHYEGGHRVPAIAWWPGKIRAGSETDALTAGTDLLPTIAELTSSPVPKERALDGTSLLNLLRDEAELPPRRLFFGYEPKLGTAMRDGKWKMIVKGETVELYDLANDIGERENLVEKLPERAREMRASIEKWKRTSPRFSDEHPVPENPLWLNFPGSPKLKRNLARDKHIVLIAAEQEYRSEQAMPMLAKILATRHGFDCTVLFAVNDQGEVDPTQKIRWQDKQVVHNIPGLEHVASADCVIFFNRLLTLPDEQIKHVIAYLDSGKPIIGIRTANHGFLQDVPYRINGKKVRFGEDVLGGSFRSHHGDWHRDSTRGLIIEEQKKHPILRGVEDIWGPSDVYRTYPKGGSLPEGCTALVLGQPLVGRKHGDAPNTKKIPLPIAWTKTWTTSRGKSARVFHVTMGSGRDFESAGLRRMTINAAYWCLGMESKIDAERSVDIVGEYKPLASGFNYEKLGVKPKPAAAYR